MRRAAVALGLLVLTGLCGYWIGLQRPAEVRTETRWRTRVQFRLLKVRVVERQESKRSVVYRDRLVKPDGTVHEREVEAHASDTQIREASRSEAAGVEVREVEKRVEVTRPAPQWRASVLAGVDPFSVRLAPLGAELYVGAAVERRILGPLFVGAWALHRGPVGLSVSAEF